MDVMSETQTDVTQDVEDTAPQPATDTAPTTGQEQPDDQTEETQPEPKKTPWFQRRIDELTREKHEERRKNEFLSDALRKIQQPAGQDHVENTAPPPGYVPANQVQQAAVEMLGRVEFHRACDDIAALGQKLPDFISALGNLQSLGVNTQNMGDPFMQAITALDKSEAARVIHEIGSDPDEAERILRMSPTRMAMEVAKIATKSAKVPAISRAPSPITPINARSVSSDAEPDGKDDAKYRAWFVRESAKRNR